MSIESWRKPAVAVSISTRIGATPAGAGPEAAVGDRPEEHAIAASIANPMTARICREYTRLFSGLERERTSHSKESKSQGTAVAVRMPSTFAFFDSDVAHSSFDHVVHSFDSFE